MTDATPTAREEEIALDVARSISIGSHSGWWGDRQKTQWKARAQIAIAKALAAHAAQAVAEDRARMAKVICNGCQRGLPFWDLNDRLHVTETHCSCCKPTHRIWCEAAPLRAGQPGQETPMTGPMETRP